jgi:hypothetical protein
VRTELISKLNPNDVIVKTGGGGIHIYTNQEEFPLTQNRLIKCFTSHQYDVDIFGSGDKNSRNLIVLPGSKVKPNNHEHVSIYEFVQGDFDSVVTRSVNEVLMDLKIKVNTSGLGGQNSGRRI